MGGGFAGLVVLGDVVLKVFDPAFPALAAFQRVGLEARTRICLLLESIQEFTIDAL